MDLVAVGVGVGREEVVEWEYCRKQVCFHLPALSLSGGSQDTARGKSLLNHGYLTEIQRDTSLWLCRRSRRWGEGVVEKLLEPRQTAMDVRHKDKRRCLYRFLLYCRAEKRQAGEDHHLR